MWDIVRFGQVTSTQNVARDLALSGECTGLVIVAETQTEGRGRRGGRWHSPKGGLYTTMVLRPVRRTGLLPILAGVAVAEAIKAVAGIEAELKWPNDILLWGRKVGGILSESGWAGDEVKFVLLGIGVNVNNPVPEDLPEATTLSSEVGKDIDIDRLLRVLIERLNHHLALLDAHPETIIRSWRSLNRTLGKRVDVTDGSGETIRGLAIDIGDDGALVLETEDGERRIVSGRLFDGTVKF